MNRTGQAVLCILVLVLCGGLARFMVSLKKQPDKKPPHTTVTRVEATRLTPQSYQVIVRTRGTVRPRTETDLVSEVSGKVTEVSPSLREGGFFDKGDILLQIDPFDYQTAVTVAKGEVARATAALEQERARAAQAAENWRRLGKKSPPGPLVLREPQLAESQATLAATRANLEKAQRDLQRATVRAPYDGRVLEQQADIGQFVTSGTSLARIYAVDYVEIRLPLNSTQLAFVDLPERYRDDPDNSSRPTPNVTLTGDIGTGQAHWEGKIVRVSGAIDERSRQLFVVAQVDDPYSRKDSGNPPLKIGLFVEATITGRTLDNVYVIPRSAVRADDEIILIGADNRLSRKRVTPLWRDRDSIVIAAGTDSHPPAGDLLCLTPLAFPADGAEVHPVTKGDAPPGSSATAL